MATTEIVHRVGIRAAAPDVFDAIVQPERERRLGVARQDLEALDLRRDPKASFR